VSAFEWDQDNRKIGSTATLIMPLNTTITYSSVTTNPITGLNITLVQSLTNYVKNVFSTGDSILVFAKYDGFENDKYAINSVNAINLKSQGWIFPDDIDPTTNQPRYYGYLPVFNGYLYDFYMGMPLKIKCLDSVYLAQLDMVNKIYIGTAGASQILPSTLKLLGDTIVKMNPPTVLKILEDIFKYTNLTIQKTDFPDIILDDLKGITFTQMSPASVLEYFKKEIGLNISIQGTKIYCNLAGGSALDPNGVPYSVNYDTSENVRENQSLQTINLTRTGKGRKTTFQQYKVKCWFLNDKGQKDSFEWGDEKGVQRDFFFYKIARVKNSNGSDNVEATNLLYKQYAQQALTQLRQRHFTGTIETYLYPYCELYWNANYKDIAYPERSGQYVITGIKGEISAINRECKKTLKFAYLNDLNS